MPASWFAMEPGGGGCGRAADCRDRPRSGPDAWLALGGQEQASLSPSPQPRVGLGAITRRAARTEIAQEELP